MKTKIISLLVIIAFAVVSCQKDEADKPVMQQDVSFGIDIVDQTGFKSTPDCKVDEDGDLLVPTIAEVEIDGDTYFVDVFYVDGKYYTQAFKLGVDDNPYTVTKFVLWTLHPSDPDAEMVMAAPEANSEYADYVSMTVPFDVTVVGFEKLEIAIEVICFLESEYDKFGFIWFEITEIVVREFCFFGDICANGDPHLPAVFVGSAYDDGDLNTPIPVDMHAIYQIHVLKNGNPYPEVGENVFSNALDPTDPLCVQFPDILSVTGESFQFELHVLVPPAFAYVHFATFDVVEDGVGNWTIEYNGVDALNDYNAVDFAIGSCSPFSDHVFPYPVAP